MKLNSPEAIKEAAKVFRSYGGSWTLAREAGHRRADGVLVIPLKSNHGDGGDGLAVNEHLSSAAE